MKEFIDKLIERLEEEHERCINRYGVVGGNLPAMEVKQCMNIANELAEEYKEERTLDCDKLLFAYSDLLRRFQNAESTVICEFSGNISKETEELETECEELLSQFKEILYSANTPQKSEEEYKVSEMPTSWVIDGKGIHKQTNADRIRSMTDEELAEFLDDLTDNCCRCAEHQNCGNCQIGLDIESGFCDIKKWLQSEAE